MPGYILCAHDEWRVQAERVAMLQCLAQVAASLPPRPRGALSVASAATAAGIPGPSLRVSVLRVALALPGCLLVARPTHATASHSYWWS